MNPYLIRSVALLSLLLPVRTGVSAGLRDDYELTVATVVKAMQGWHLYGAKEFAGRFKDGHYTDPDPKTKVYDFWSDGLIAKLDRDNNGHFETLFMVDHNQLVYVGSTGRRGTLIHVARDQQNYLGQPASSFIREIHKKRAR